MQDYRSLRVWQDSRNLALEIYRLTSEFPPDERFGLVTQMRRAAVSVSSNLAEGCSRSGRRDFARFLEMALGSVYELEVQLDLAVTLDMASDDRSALDRCDKLKRSIIRLINTVHSEKDGKDPAPKTNRT
ncbi:MAG: four helix bundle protein [Acidimicrobiia bacterium]